MLNITDNLDNALASKVQQLIDFFNENNFEDIIFYGNILLDKFPENPLVNNIMGLSYYALGNFSKAICHFQACIRLEKNFFEAYNNLGVIYNNLNNPKKAKQLFQEAIMIKSDYADAYYNLGIAEKILSNNETAYNNFRKAYKLNKTDEKVVHAYSEILISLNKQEKAILVLEKFIINNNKSFISYHLIGQLYEEKQHYDDAIKNYKKAILINENFLPSIGNLGKIYSDINQNKFALLLFEKGLTKIKTSTINYNGSQNFCLSAGMFFNRLGKIDRAYECFNLALRIDPNNIPAKVEKFRMMRLMCDWSEFYYAKNYISKLNFSNINIQPYSLLIQYDDPFNQKCLAENYALLNFNSPKNNKLELFKTKAEKIKIAYFSADFLDHPVSKLLAKMISLHDKDQFEVYCFSFKSDKNCKIQNYFKDKCDFFYDVEDLTNTEIVKMARNNNIHFAIDLMGYTRGSRTEIFSMRSAPIQINYLGYSSTTGANFMDFIIADEITIPKINEKYFSEKVIRLPNSFMPTDDSQPISKKIITRDQMMLPKKGIVFCSFNRSEKICPDVFDIWMEVLLKIEGSSLWLSKPNYWAEMNILNEAKNRGVDPSRIIFSNKVEIEEHYKRHQLADLFLDTFDYNSHSTAVDALWSGLPLVTKIGKGFQARIASSLLSSVGMNELITKNNQEYKKLILTLARDPKKITYLKDKLIKNLKDKPLFNTLKYTRNFEKTLTQIFCKYKKI